MAERVLGGRYRLGEPLGHGGMADVHRAHDLVLDRQVAVKVLRERAGDPTDRARFTSEARTLAALSHPHLVMVLDAGIDVEQPFLVMELVEGATLTELVRSAPLTPEQAAVVGARVAAALGYAHEAGVVHRDVKPANVLVGGDPAGGARERGRDTGWDRVKLADFGVARLVGDTVRHTRAGTALGTAAYLAPEQVGAGDVTGRADVYSLGLVLLEALTGRRSFEGSATEAALARLARDPEVPASLPADWRELLTAMTDRDPHRRPGAAEVALRLADAPAPVVPVGSVPAVPWSRSTGAGPATAATQPLTAVAAPTTVFPGLDASPGPRAASRIDRAGDALARVPGRLLRTWRTMPSHQRGVAAAVLAILLLVLVAGVAGGPSGDGAPDGPGRAPVEQEEPSRRLPGLDDRLGR